MPTFNRRDLRQRLGRYWLHDTLVANTTGSWGATASLQVLDANRADPTASGEQLYTRAWLVLHGSSGVNQVARVASFNILTGAFQTLVAAATVVFSGQDYEVHQLISGEEKDRALDQTVKDLRLRREYPLWSVPGLQVYSLPDEVLDVVGVRAFADPAGSQGRDERHLEHWRVVTTATGRELRISPALLASQQIVLDAVLAMTLGVGEVATINLPDADWVLSGAAARCFWMLEQQSPGQEAGAYKQRRIEAGRRFTALSRRFQPPIERPFGLPDGEVW